MKRSLVVAFALICSACGGDGASPVAPPVFGGSLRAGPYTLQVTRASSAACFSLGIGPAATAQLDMTVSATSDGWRVALASSGSGDLVLTLVRAGIQVSGRGTGRGTATTLTLVLDNALSGGVDATNASASGFFTGNVTYSGTAGSTVCTENSWSLTPR